MASANGGARLAAQAWALLGFDPALDGPRTTMDPYFLVEDATPSGVPIRRVGRVQQHVGFRVVNDSAIAAPMDHVLSGSIA